MKLLMMTTVICLPLLSAAVGVLIAYLSCRRPYLSSAMEQQEQHLVDNAFYAIVAAKIDEKIDAVVQVLKEEVPMAHLFLSQAREDKMKEQACRELYKMIPDIERLARLDSNVSTSSSSFTYSKMATSALIGLALGVVSVFIMWLVCV